MWYDTLNSEQQSEIKSFIIKTKNTEKDPQITHQYLTTIIKHAALFNEDGKYIRLSSNTRPNEHIEIMKALIQTKAKQTLEVGFAYGTSALVFAEYHQKAKNTGICHTIIDPNQFGTGSGNWDGIGVLNLKRCGFIKGKNYRLIEDTSTLALPDLLKKKGGGWADVALIDGWHLFDYTLIDVFYCLKLLRVGGICIVDDKRMRAIKAIYKYITRAYSQDVIDICESCPTMIVIRKKAEDTRDWNADEVVNFNLS